MSLLSNIVSTIAKPASIIAPIVGGPAGTAVAIAANAKVRSDAQRQQREQIEIYNRNRRNQMAEIFGTGNVSSVQAPLGSTANTGGGGFTFSNFLSDIGTNVINPLANFFTGSGNNQRPLSSGQQPAVTTITNLGASETSGSGTVDAGFGFLPTLFPKIGNILRTPLGGLLGGTAVGGAISLIDPNTGRTRRITRKIKSQARMLLNLNMGDLQRTADMMGITQQELVFILLKRFRNDGPVVTKAALRKTKQTVRRLKSMCDMYDDLRPRATARRKSPMRRATTTLISNK